MSPARKAPLHARYIEAFEYFKQQSGDNYFRSLIAFALFVDAVAKYSDDGASEGEVRKYFDLAVTQFSRQFFSGADDVMVKIANDFIVEKQSEIISEAIDHAHRVFRWRGVCEAFFGALAWTVFLILISLLAVWAVPDVVEYLRKAYHIAHPAA